MINFFKKEYKDRLKACKTDEFFNKFIHEDEDGDHIDMEAFIDTVFQKGWEAYRAAVLEASYLDK